MSDPPKDLLPQTTEHPVDLPLSALPVEPSGNKPTLFSAKLQEIRTQSQHRIQHAQSLFAAPADESDTENITSALSSDEIVQKLTDFITIPPSQETEFLAQSQNLLQTSAQVIKKTVAEQRALQDQYYAYQDDLGWKMERRIIELDNTKGIRKLPAMLEKRRMLSQKPGIEAKIKLLDEQIQAKKQLINTLLKQEKGVKEKREDVLLREMGLSITAVRSDYETFLGEILDDGTLTSEITEAYIHEIIQPEVDRIMQERELSEEKREDFYSALRTYISHREDSEEVREPFREKLDVFLTWEGGFCDISNQCQALQRGSDKKIIVELVAKIAADDLLSVKNNFLSLLSKEFSRQKFENVFKDAVDPTYHNRFYGFEIAEKTFGRQILSEFTDKSEDNIPDMQFWTAVKSSETAMGIFGDEIQKQDQEYYSAILDKSLSDKDGEYIDRLYYYPTADAIRNLVILAAADTQNYRTIHANWTLSRLKERSNWKDILDTAEKKYPSLTSARSVLESWNYIEYWRHPDITDTAINFTLSVFESDKPVDSKIKSLALEALPDRLLIELLVKRETIDDAVASTLRNIESLFDTQRKLENENRDTFLKYHIEDYYLRTKLRGTLQVLLQPGETPPNDEKLESLKRLATLSQKILDTQTNHAVVDYLTSQVVIDAITDKKIKPELIFQIPEYAGELLKKDKAGVLNLIFENSETWLHDKQDLEFLSKLVGFFNEDPEYFLNHYLEGLKNGEITRENRTEFLEKYKVFFQTYTAFSPERMTQFTATSETPFGRTITDLVTDEVERNKMIFDYACFTQRLETNKINLIVQMIKNGVKEEDMKQTFNYLRWLPENEISAQDNLSTLETKYIESAQRLKTGFNRIFPNAEELLRSPENFQNLTEKINEVCGRFKFKMRVLSTDNIKVALPEGFIKEFNLLRRRNSEVQLVPELASYLIRETSRLATAFTVEDLIFSQIGQTEDLTGRRRGRYAAEQLLEVMENNVEASLLTWATAIGYQKEKSDSPLFIIANERTGPADLAAEYLPKDFAQKFNISQSVDYDKFFTWFRGNKPFVEDLYEKFKAGENVKDAIPKEILTLLGMDRNLIIPIYRLKIPSSLNAAAEEPAGIDTVLSFLKFASIAGGRTLFMDESTRTAPRSIECLYNVLNRRQDLLGGTHIRLFGKIDGVTGQNQTVLKEVKPETSHLEIAFIDPWHSQIKSVTDDSVGFVPEVSGSGIVEIARPSYTSVSPYGINTVQDFWKQLIANEVTLRYEGFEESGRTKKRREEFKPAPKADEEILTQDELKEMAFEKPYKALVIDLDGTTGSGGKYNQKIIDIVKNLSSSGTDVVIATARSLVENPNYDGSVKSFIQQLKELSEAQKSHLYFAAENGAIVSSLDKIDSPYEQHLISDELAASVNSLTSSLSPDIQIYKEQGTIVLRGFTDDKKQETMDFLQKEIERMGLPLKITSDSKHSIHIRVGEASKRNILNFLESKGITIDQIAKIGDSPDGNDKPMFWGRGAFNVGDSRSGTFWTIHMNEYGGGPVETEHLLDKLQFLPSK